MLFSAPMVRANLSDQKTQTRRIMKPQPVWNDARQHWERDSRQGMAVWSGSRPQAAALLGLREECPYGVPGDRLWVKETWQAWQCVSTERDEWEPITREVRGGSRWAEWIETNGEPDAIEHRATSESVGPWTPSIHMPRWASRLTLEITAVRVERLHEITQADARAEGVVDTTGAWEAATGEPLTDTDQAGPRGAYRALWESINGAGSWEANPWVWVISFRVVRP